MLALDDLEAIVRYISNDSEVYAADMAARIVNTVDHLEAFPTMGRHLPNSDDDEVREVIAPPYRILYRFDGKRVTIGAIVHGARDLSTFLFDREI